MSQTATKCPHCHRDNLKSAQEHVRQMEAQGWQGRPAHRAAVESVERLTRYVREDGECSRCGRSDVPELEEVPA